MKKLIFTFFLMAIFTSLFAQKSSNVVVVIDPGHGGLDSGAVFYKNNFSIIEATYSYDVALRLQKMLSDSGLVVYKTITNDAIIEDKDTLTKYYSKTYFSLDSSLVSNKKADLNKRVLFTNKIVKQYSGKKVIFISLHFDIANPGVLGMRIITPKDKNNKFTNLLISEFKKRSLFCTSKYCYVLKTGKGGIKNLLILSEANKASVKVCIELENLQTHFAVDRVCDQETRQIYALMIFNAIKELSNKGHH